MHLSNVDLVVITGLSYISGGAQFKMKTQNSLKIYLEFQDGDSRTLNQPGIALRDGHCAWEQA